MNPRAILHLLFIPNYYLPWSSWPPACRGTKHRGLFKGWRLWKHSRDKKNIHAPFWTMEICPEWIIHPWLITEDRVICFSLCGFCFVYPVIKTAPKLTESCSHWSRSSLQPLSDFSCSNLTCVLFHCNKWSVTLHDWLNTQGSHSKLGQTFLIISPPCQWYSPPNFSLMNLQYGGVWAANQR